MTSADRLPPFPLLARKTVLLTGVTGYIGSELAPHLARWGARVVGTARPDRLDETRRKAVTHPLLSAVDEWRPLDLDAPTDAMAAILGGVDLVIHAAALRGERGLAPQRVAAANTDAAARLFRAAAARDVPDFLFFSTVGVHGMVAGGNEDSPWSWDDSDYHVSKARAEITLRTLHGPRLRTVRPCIVYGQRRTDGYLRSMARLIWKRRFAPIGSRDARIDLVHIDNLIEGIRVILDRADPGTAWIVTDGAPITVPRIAELLARGLDRPLPGFRIPEAPVRVAASLVEQVFRALDRPAPITPNKLDLFTRDQYFDVDRIRSLGWSPLVQTEPALLQTAAAWRLEWSAPTPDALR